MPADLLNIWRSSSAANPHTVQLGTPTPGRDIWMWFVVPAYTTTPSGWTQEARAFNAQGEAILLRLPGASNSGATTVSIGWSGGARTMQAIVWEDDPLTSGTLYVSIANAQDQTADTPALWGSNLHNFTSRESSFALYATQLDSNSDGSGQAASVDNSHTIFAQSATGFTVSAPDNVGLIVVTEGPSPDSMSADGVTLTMNKSKTAMGAGVGYAGMVAYDTDVFDPGGDPPVSTVAPVLSGSTVEGGTANCSTGSWTNSPTSYAYQWKRNGTNIAGATANSRVLSATDVGQTITCLVTATNGDGDGTASSNSITPTGALGGGKLTIAEENELEGEDFDQYTIGGAGDSTNLGYSKPFSLNVGETVEFYCDGTGTVIDIYRIGYYGGNGWCKKDTIVNTPQDQPNPVSIPNSNGQTTCSNWTKSAEWEVPAIATPGLYVGVFRSSPGPNASWIPFVVHDPDRPADIMYKTSDATWGLAYNNYGTPASPFTGNNVYGSGSGVGNANDRSYCNTYNKPIITRQGVPQTYWYACEYPMIRYLERMGFDINYSACRDWHDGGAGLAECNIYLSCGHDEYWSQNMRAAWEIKRDAGKHLIFASGNEVFWRVRWDAANEIMWCYKDTLPGPTGSGHTAGTALDPVSWTGTFKDTRPANLSTFFPENTLTGTDFRMNGVNDRSMVIGASDPEGDHPFWRNTTVSAIGVTSGSGLIGFEADEAKPVQPAGSFKYLAKSGVNATGIYADDNGENYSGTKNPMDWGIVSQRYESGAVVVGFGTCQWSWGLDGFHDRGANISDSRFQQATYNLLRDLGATPVTPISGLVAPTPVNLDNYGVIPGSTPEVVRKARYHRLNGGVWETLDFSIE